MSIVRRRWVVAALCGLSVVPLASAQSPPPVLTLEDCIRLAESAPSPVQLAKQQSEIANLGLKQARAAFLPKTEFASGFVYNSPLKGNSPTQSYVALNGVREYLFLLNATQELDLSGRLRADQERARAELDLARAGENISRRDLKRGVTAAYYRLLLARHIAKALRDSVAEAESFERRTQLLAENGEASQADRAKASAATAGLRQALNAAELDAGVANQELASFWTTAVNAPLEITDVFETAPGASEASAAAGGARPFAGRPEFGLLDAQKRGFLAESRRIRAELLPQASMNFQYGLDSPAVRAHDHGYALFVNLSVPIFDWMRTLNASREFQARVEQTETQRAMAERAFSREYEAAQARMENAVQQIALAARQVKLSEEDLRLSRIRFEGGEGPALDVVAAQNQLAQARVSYFVAIASYWNARADREVAAGR